MSNRYNLTISQDENSENPRKEWDNIGTMLCTHKRYRLGDEDNLSPSDILEKIAEDVGIDTEKYENGEISEEDLYNQVMHFDGDAVVLPISLYDHSGISMSIGEQRGFDSGQVGFIYVTYEEMAKEHGIDEKYLKKQKDWANGRDLKQVAYDILEGEVETYNEYLQGNIYQYSLETLNSDGELVNTDSCGGFFGSDLQRNGLLGSLPTDLKDYMVEKGDVKAYNFRDDEEYSYFIKNDDFEITEEIKDAAIDKLVKKDIEDILENAKNDDFNFLTNVLSGNNFTQYNHMSSKELDKNYLEQFEQNIEDAIKEENLKISSDEVLAYADENIGPDADAGLEIK